MLDFKLCFVDEFPDYTELRANVGRVALRSFAFFANSESNLHC